MDEKLKTLRERRADGREILHDDRRRNSLDGSEGELGMAAASPGHSGPTPCGTPPGPGWRNALSRTGPPRRPSRRETLCGV